MIRTAMIRTAMSVTGFRCWEMIWWRGVHPECRSAAPGIGLRRWRRGGVLVSQPAILAIEMRVRAAVLCGSAMAS